MKDVYNNLTTTIIYRGIFFQNCRKFFLRARASAYLLPYLWKFAQKNQKQQCRISLKRLLRRLEIICNGKRYIVQDNEKYFGKILHVILYSNPSNFCQYRIK